MNSQSIPILTPVGRIVSGDPWKPQDRNYSGAPLTIATGPNAGQPRVNYYVGLAVLKTDPDVQALIATIKQAAREGFPKMFDASGDCTNPTFAWKYVDGDSTVPDAKGNTPNSREGYPGHIIFSFSTGFQPKRVTTGGEEDIIDKALLKRGDYVRIAGTVVGNGSTQAAQSGVFLNWTMVEFQRTGEAINIGPSAKEIFGGGVPVTAAPAPAPAPHPDILTPPVDTLTARLTPAAGAGRTWKDMEAAGWTEEKALAQGMLSPA